MKFYQQTIEQVVKSLNTNTHDGLTQEEVKKRLQKYGPNSIPEKKPTSAFIIFLKQFTSPLMFILLIASVLSVIINEPGDAIVIMIAVVVNVIIGFFQEYKAQKAALSLKSYEVPHCYAKRNGKIAFIKSRDLVPGDIIVLSAGTRIPADARLTNVIDFEVEEAILTGEANPVIKNTMHIDQKVSVGDRTNMGFAGTYVLRGKAEGIVVNTGADSYLGQIAQLVTSTKEHSTPLQEQIKKLSWWLGAILLGITTLVAILGLIKGMHFHEIFMISIALAVAAIPEGLLVAVTVILAIGMQRMLKRHALVRHLVAAETLGSVSVICTDKTGTLTKGHMQVTQIVTEDHDIKMVKQTSIPEQIENILTLTTLNNDAQIEREDSKKNIGHPTEIALLQAANDLNIDTNNIRQKYERINEIPFSSNLKYMATVHKMNGHEKLIVKGAPEKIFAMCDAQDNIERFKRLADKMASDGLRILAVATKTTEKIDLKKDLYGLDCIGLIGIQDPLRSQAVSTVKELQKAGIRIILVTGDHKDTATSIGRSAGISNHKNITVTGPELDKMSDEQLDKEIHDIDIFARVDPRHKIRIVRSWQKAGNAVAMTGDGVNDAPALKAADIGVALGSGSDVAHEVSDMVILDDNLSTIDMAVKEGRVIFDNLRKVITYLMTDSFCEIILVAGALLVGLPIPILATQILWINLLSDGLPYLALTVEPAEPEVMQEKPRAKNEPILNKEMKILIFLIGIITDIGLFGLFIALLKLNFNLEHTRTIIFTAASINSLFYVFAVRSFRKSLFQMNPFSNHWLNAAVIGGFIMQLAVVYLPPLQSLFSTVSLNFFEWVIIFGLASIKLVAIEITKKFFIINKN